MSLFPWHHLAEMLIWFVLGAGLWHFSDQLAATMLQNAYVRRNPAWFTASALILGTGMFVLFYMAADLLVGEAALIAETVISLQGRFFLAGSFSLLLVVFFTAVRFFSLQRDVLVTRVLTEWDFSFDDLLDEQDWGGATITEAAELVERLGRGRLALAILGVDGEIIALAVRRLAELRLQEGEAEQLATWVSLLGGQSASLTFRPEEDYVRPGREEMDSVRSLVAAMSAKKISIPIFLYFDGQERHCLHNAAAKGSHPQPKTLHQQGSV
ncbi:hypothetical protein [Heliophilum fasciatum]|uniref:Uncharacterized protein n=1 Tax=Heliophilum fasciatum TaxID=35700 RepID=A0A4R2RD36_9FIRM|nr:hypothetical protein [Heliophilum fasciatum]MCW2279456.1 hypothetical protein [Heliophilum fasciatum]TCP59877.1 hypothetical protein EDD73_1477 [Heliophilum fasciatum]